MALRIGKGWVFGGLGAAVAALLVWAWIDGGERPVTAMTAPAVLPGEAR